MVFLVILLIVPWTVWWKLVDRKRIAEIFSFGILITVVSSFLNLSGLHLGLWSYPYRLLPYSPKIYVLSYAVLPVTFMLMFQYFAPGSHSQQQIWCGRLLCLYRTAGFQVVVYVRVDQVELFLLLFNFLGYGFGLKTAASGRFSEKTDGNRRGRGCWREKQTAGACISSL